MREHLNKPTDALFYRGYPVSVRRIAIGHWEAKFLCPRNNEIWETGLTHLNSEEAISAAKEMIDHTLTSLEIEARFNRFLAELKGDYAWSTIFEGLAEYCHQHTELEPIVKYIEYAASEVRHLRHEGDRR
ncbi:MAG: hypothetical protein MJA27_19555 [Pseudanabaenales cyanobacterium]|nr:hypothetical protein [Pseudanabaenales cyanobacterium]